MFEDRYTLGQGQKMLPRESKIMLANIIRHTETHNRIIEEEECWKQRSLQRENETKEFNYSSDRSGFDMMHKKCRWLLESRNAVGQSRAHMDCKDDVQRHSYEGREESTGTFWMRQLDNFESRDPDRWGHSGYKELYPQDFLSESEKDNVKQMNKCHSSKKRSHSPENEVKKKRKKSRSDRKLKKEKKKKRKKRRRSTSCHESETDSRKERHHKKRKVETDCSSHKNKHKLCKKRKKLLDAI